MVTASALNVDPGQGVTIGFNIGNNNTLYAYWSNLFADLNTLGCTWIRLNYSWRNIERTQGTYTWTVLDDAVSHINASTGPNGGPFKLLYCLRDAPTWALVNTAQKATSEPQYMPDPTLMAGFASAVVGRYNGGAHGHIDALGYNEDFNIDFTPTTDTLTTNQSLTNAGGPYTSFAITAAGQPADPGTLIYLAGFGNTTDVATVSTAVAAGDTTVHINSFTPAVTYASGTHAKVAYIRGAHNSSYDLYNPGSLGVRTGLKSQPARDGYYAAQVMLAVTPAVRAINATLPIGTPCIWWLQPSNPPTFPNGFSNMTAYLTQIYTTAGSVIDAYTFLDGHYYSNAVDPTLGNGQTSTIHDYMADIAAVSAAFSDTGRQIWVTEFGWQIPTDVATEAIQSTNYSTVLNAVIPGTNPNKNKIFFFTLWYAPTGGTGGELVYWNGSGYSYRQAFGTLETYLTLFPNLVQSATGSVGSSNAASVTVSTSATGSANLLVAFVEIQSTTSVTITPPTGWSQVGTTSLDSAGSNVCAMFYKANSSPGLTSFVFSFSASVNAAVAFEEWNGVATSSPLDQYVVKINGNTTADTTGTTATLANAGELAVWGLALHSSTLSTYSAVTNGYSEDTGANASSTKATKAQATLFANTNVGRAVTSSGVTASVTARNTTILAVFRPTAAAPALATSPTSMSFSAGVGGGNPASQSDTLSETNNVATNWTSSISYGSGSGWLSLSPSSGSLSALGSSAVTVSCTTGSLAAGTYTATITYTATSGSGGATATIAVTFNVGAAALGISSTPLGFSAVAGGSNPASQQTVLSEVNNVSSAWTSSIAYTVGSGWLAISPTSGTLSALGSTAITVSCTTGSLAIGTYKATITFTATSGGATSQVAVWFTVITSTTVASLNAYGASLNSNGTPNAPGSLFSTSSTYLAVADSGTSRVRWQIPWNSIEHAVQTTSSTAVSSTGSYTISVAAWSSQYTVSANLLIDVSGSQQETVTITAVSVATRSITATFAKTHTTTPYPVAAVPASGDSPGTSAKVAPYDWSVLDDSIQICQASGLFVDFVLQSAPSWHAEALSIDSGQSVPVAADTAQFMTDLFSHLQSTFGAKNQFSTIEIANEGFNTGLLTSGNASTMFGQMYTLLNTVAPVITSNSPATLIGAPAELKQTSTNVAAWTTGFFAANCHTLVNYVTFHFYPTAAPDGQPVGSENLADWIAQWQSAMAGAGASLPIHITECGWTMIDQAGTNGGIADATYNGYLQTLLSDTASSVAAIYLYDLDSVVRGTHFNDTSTLQTYKTWKNAIASSSSSPLSPYPLAVLGDSPRVYYRLDESSGSIARDSSGNGYTGTISGVAGYSVPGIEGSRGATAISFTKAGQVLFPTNLAPYSWSDASLEFWVNDTTGWHYVVMTTTNSSGATLLYLDGVTASSGSGGSIMLDQLFGFAGSLTQAWSLDEVALYNYVLTPDQIAAHFAAALSPSPPPLTLPTIFTVTIGGQSVLFDESTFQIQYKENEAWRCQFTALDYSGNQVFPYRSQVTVYDPALGYLFTGFLIDDTFDKSNTMANVAREHKIDCIGNESKGMKRTSNRIYKVPFPAAQAVIDMLNDTLISEGVTAKYALSTVSTQTLWNAGSLSGTIGSATLPDGDLELSPAGSTLTIAESTTSDFSAGTLTNVTAASNALTLQTYNGFSMTATCIGSIGNAFLYYNLYGTNTSQPNNWNLEYTMWIDGSSPKIIAGVDIVYTDGTTLRDSHTLDQHGIDCHPGTDLAGWANDQWFYRRIGLQSFTGKTINYVSIAFEGDSAGMYGVYLQSCKLTYLGVTQLDVLANYQGGQISNNGYAALAAKQLTVYAQTGNRVSSSHSLASVGIYQNSLASWIVATPANTSFLLETSFDGGATWQTATNKASLGIITAGSSLSARSLLLRETLSLTGHVPTITPSLTNVAVTFVPAYAATLNDAFYTRSTDADFNAGVLANTVAATNSGLGLRGFWRDWSHSDINTLASDQTVYGTASPSQRLNYNQLVIDTNSGTDAKVRLDGAGNTWQDFTMSVIVQVPVASSNTGMVYRTTGWQNNNDTYGYAVTVKSTLIELAHGTNSGSGAGAFTSIATAAVSLTVGNFYTLKVVVISNSHKVYLDDVQYINVSDSTYPAAGYVGLRNYNSSGGGLAQFFGSFSLVKWLSGTYVSGNLSLNSVGTVDTSRIFWQDVAPGTSTVLFETSINGGTTWQTATYGQEIAGLSHGTSVVGVNLKVRITLTDLSEQDQPVVTGYTAWVTSAYSSSGTYVSPLLSLAPVGQVGNTLVAWAALRPANTTITVDSSIDSGATWQTNVAPGSLVTTGSTQYAGLGTIGTINTQHDPTVDGFTANTSANYTQNHGSGGSNATWTPDTANQRVSGAGGGQAFYAYTSISSVNMDVLSDMTRSDAGGLVFCYSDATHYYSVVVGDRQSSVVTPNTITLYRNGVSVASATIAFTRGLIYRVRASIFSGVITVSFDGVQLLTYTDGSPLPAGKAGLFTNGGTAYFTSLWIQPLGDDVTSKSVMARVNLASTDPTATPQVQSLAFGAYGPQINTGTIIPSADYRGKFLNTVLDDLTKQSNYQTHIDQLNAIYFTGAQAKPAPWVLQSNILDQPSDIELDSNLAVETLGDVYRNRQILTGVINSAVFEDSFVGDGTKTSFTLRYPIATGSIPTIELDGATQTVGLKGTAGSNWYYAEGDAVIAQDTTTALPLTTADTLVVFPYTGTFTDEVVVNNLTAQAALAVFEGGTGIVEAVEDVSSKNMTFAAAVTYANQLLTRFCTTGRQITFKTYRNGLAVGMMQPAYLPEENLNYAQLLIHEIQLGMQTQPNNTVLYNYLVTASELPVLASWSKLLASGLLQ